MQAHEYQILPYDYYVKDFFLAKSLLYVLRYKNDNDLFALALEEAATAYKIPKTVIEEHVYNIEALQHIGESHAVSESGTELL